MDQRLRLGERIRRRSEFQRAHDRGVRLHGRFFMLVVLPTTLDVARLGIVATRKLGGAARRNRAKRLIRELFRRNKAPGGLDVVVIPRPDVLEAEFASLEADYRSVLRRYRRENHSSARH